MNSNSYIPVSNFVDLLNSQQETVFGFVQESGEVSSSQVPLFSSQATEAETTGERKESRSWTPVDDVALISAWLNTSKDPVVGNEQRAGIILHNMIVEDERDGYTQFDASEFQQGEDTRTAHVDLAFSTNMPTNIANMMGVLNKNS